MSAYTKSVFGMFGGKEQKVTHILSKDKGQQAGSQWKDQSPGQGGYIQIGQ